MGTYSIGGAIAGATPFPFETFCQTEVAGSSGAGVEEPLGAAEQFPPEVLARLQSAEKGEAGLEVLELESKKVAPLKSTLGHGGASLCKVTNLATTGKTLIRKPRELDALDNLVSSQGRQGYLCRKPSWIRDDNTNRG